MPKAPTPAQLQQFMQTTGCPDKSFAVEHLQNHNCNVSKAINDYLDRDLGLKFSTDSKGLEILFDSYANEKTGLMEQTGIVNFFGKSKVDLVDILPVIFSYEGNASAMGVYKKEEFVKAMQNLGLKDEQSFAEKRKMIKEKYGFNKSLFNNVFKYAFGYMAGG